MLTLRNILFARDFTSNSEEALPFALKLAQQSGATLHAVFAEVVYGARFERAAGHAEPDPQEPDGDAIMQALTDADGVAVKHAVVRGVSAAPALLDYAHERDIDLIVMGTHGRRGVRRMLMGSVAEEVVRGAPCPVLTVQPSEQPRNGTVSRILVPIDFSKHARRALLHARALAEQFGAKLLLLHVIEEKLHPAFYTIALQSIYDADPFIEDKALAQLKEEFAAAGGRDDEAEFVVLYGVAPGQILDVAAESQADLIVMGTHGLTGLDRFFMGSVAEKVVRRAPCPVFTVKSFGKMLVPEAASAS